MGKGDVVAAPDLPFEEAQMIASAIGEASASRRRTEAELSVALRELAHRLKNLIMVVQALVRQTGRHTNDIMEFRRLLGNRLDGLSNSINLLIAHQKAGVPIEELVRAQLGSFLVDWDRITLAGPRIMVRDEAVQRVGMILHELATNATKYGALARPEGTIQISWSKDPPTEFTRLVWRETGVTGSTAIVRGFGSELIEGTASTLGGSAVLNALEGVLTWTLKLKLTAPVFPA
jgi:two-component sensor histidine kinase